MKERLNELLACFEKELIESSFEAIKQYLDEYDAAGLDNLNDKLGAIDDQLDHAKWQLRNIKGTITFTADTIRKKGD